MDPHGQQPLGEIVRDIIENRPVSSKIKRFLDSEAVTEIGETDQALLRDCLINNVDPYLLHKTVLHIYLRHAAMWIQLDNPRTHKQWMDRCQSQ